MSRPEAERELKRVEAILAEGRKQVQHLISLLMDIDRNGATDTAEAARDSLHKTLESQDLYKRRRDELHRKLG